MKKQKFQNWLEKDNPKATKKMIEDCIKRIERIEEIHGNVESSDSAIVAGLNNKHNLYSPYGRGEKGRNALKTAYKNYKKFMGGSR